MPIYANLCQSMPIYANLTHVLDKLEFHHSIRSQVHPAEPWWLDWKPVQAYGYGPTEKVYWVYCILVAWYNWYKYNLSSMGMDRIDHIPLE